MFFRRQPPKKFTFAERLENLRKAGYAVGPAEGGCVRVRKDCCAADVEEGAEGRPAILRVGIVSGNELALLVDGGFQKFFRTPGGRRIPALAGDLKNIHNFDEDLRETLGLESYYNQSLGTTCEYHQYDRLTGRD